MIITPPMSRSASGKSRKTLADTLAQMDHLRELMNIGSDFTLDMAGVGELDVDRAARELSGQLEERQRVLTAKLHKSETSREEIIDAMISLMDLRLGAQAALFELQIAKVVQSLQGRDTTEMLTSEELAQALNVSAETVRKRTHAGELIALLGPGRKRGREYPAFQAWEGIAGHPLQQVLEALGKPDATASYQFMTSPTDYLGGLTPLEVLTGNAPQDAPLAEGARQFLQEADDVRRQAVIDAARQFASAREAA